MSGPRGMNPLSEDTEMSDTTLLSAALPVCIQPAHITFLDATHMSASSAPRQGDCSDEQWEALKPTIDLLWNLENLTFSKLQVTLRDHFNFYPTKRQFQRMIKNWGFDKYVKEIEMAAVSRKRRRRLANGKRSEFYIRNREVSAMSIDRWESRHPRTLLATGATPESIMCFTPKPSGHAAPTAETQVSPSETIREERFEAAIYQPEPVGLYQAAGNSASDQLGQLIVQMRQSLSAKSPQMSLRGVEFQLLEMTKPVRLSSFVGPLSSQDGVEVSQEEAEIAFEQTKATSSPSAVARTHQVRHMHISRVIEVSPFPNTTSDRSTGAQKAAISTRNLQNQKLIELKHELDKLKADVGPESPRTLLTMIGLAEVLRNQGRIPKAERLLRYAATTSERLFGLEDTITMYAYYEIIKFMTTQGRESEAYELEQSTLSTALKRLDPEHDVAQFCLGLKADFLWALKRHDEGEDIERNVVQFRLTRLGLRSKKTLAAIECLHRTLSRKGRFEEAEELMRVILHVQKDVTGVSEAEIYQHVDRLACVMIKQGRVEESLKLLKEAVARSSASLGDLDQVTLECNASMAWCLKDTNRISDSVALYLQIFEGYLKVMGPAHNRTLIILEELGETWSLLEAYDKAAKCFKKVFEIREKTQGPSHRETVRCGCILRNCYKTQGLYDEAHLLSQKLYHAKNGLSTTSL